MLHSHDQQRPFASKTQTSLLTSLIKGKAQKRSLQPSSMQSSTNQALGDFKKISKDEMEGLLHPCAWTVVPRFKADGNSIFDSRFIDLIKHEVNPQEYRKSRLAVQG